MELTRDSTMVLVVDVQGNLAQAMTEKETLFANLKKLILGARLLGLPIILTEQYPEGLGPTIPELRAILPDVQALRKVAFSCCGEPTIMQALERIGRKQVLVAGIETHVCIYQTTRDLLKRGYQVAVLADAVSSRHPNDRSIGLSRMRDQGATLASVEMVLFELMREAVGPTFKEMLKIIK